MRPAAALPAAPLARPARPASPGLDTRTRSCFDARVEVRGSLRTRLVRASPALVLVTVLSSELLTGRSPVVGLFVVAPVFAAVAHGPRVTAAFGAAGLVLAAVLGLGFDAYTTDGETLAAQLVRLAFIVVGTAAAVVASHDRVDREARLGRMTKVADAAQRAILVPVPERVGPAAVAVHYESAATDALIGGDLYAVVETPFGVRAVVGDVRGKGLDAVRLSAAVLAAFRERASDARDLDALLTLMDRTVERTALDDEDYVTAVLVQVAPDGTTTVADAGHPPPVVLSAGRTRTLASHGARPPLGLGGHATTTVLTLRPGDRVLLYTDGLTEARAPVTRRFLSPQVIAGALSAGESPADVVEALRAEAVQWSGGELGDDLALVVLEYAPPPESGDAGGPAAVDHEVGARDEGRERREQERDRARDVVGLAEPP
jgi:phosphoserine phosphatase RsbU/P